MWSLINDLGVNWVNLLRNPTQWQATNANDAVPLMTSKPFIYKSTIRPVPKDYQNWVNEIYNKNTIIQEWNNVMRYPQ
jgi:hypothetical protein